MLSIFFDSFLDDGAFDVVVVVRELLYFFIPKKPLGEEGIDLRMVDNAEGTEMGSLFFTKDLILPNCNFFMDKLLVLGGFVVAGLDVSHVVVGSIDASNSFDTMPNVTNAVSVTAGAMVSGTTCSGITPVSVASGGDDAVMFASTGMSSAMGTSGCCSDTVIFVGVTLSNDTSSETSLGNASSKGVYTSGVSSSLVATCKSSTTSSLGTASSKGVYTSGDSS